MKDRLEWKKGAKGYRFITITFRDNGNIKRISTTVKIKCFHLIKSVGLKERRNAESQIV